MSNTIPELLEIRGEVFINHARFHRQLNEAQSKEQ